MKKILFLLIFLTGCITINRYYQYPKEDAYTIPLPDYQYFPPMYYDSTYDYNYWWHHQPMIDTLQWELRIDTLGIDTLIIK